MALADDVIRRQTVLRADRFVVTGRTATMMAVVTMGQGGFDKLAYREVPVPAPAAGEVLIQVLAAGMNTTEINTRLGWYSAGVTVGTGSIAAAAPEEAARRDDGGWSAATPFPLIQGTDCCGRVVAVGPGGDASLVGRRVLVRPCMRPQGFGSVETIWMASDFDGAFAQYVKVPASEAFAVECALSDIELGAIPCSYGTAENMLRRAGLGDGEHVLVAGASGGVGAAVVQLAKHRGAGVTAICAPEKAERVPALGADRVVARDDDIVGCLGEECVDVVVDNVSGPAFGGMLKVLRRGGRYVSSGAIGGPLVTLDKRTFYLKDLTLIGCTAWDEPVFPDVLRALERGVRPPVAKTFPLEKIADAQREFLEKRHVGNFVLIPPSPGG
jgi:NADPH:quinone reductase-like Zn-dependent oxidoreductase